MKTLITLSVSLTTLLAAATSAQATSWKPISLTSPLEEFPRAVDVVPAAFTTEARNLPGTRVIDRDGRDLGFVQYVVDPFTLRIKFRGQAARDVPAQFIDLRRDFRFGEEDQGYQVLYTGPR
ncbi:MAG: hypothetical protein AAFY73_02390 [Pseudomonadota bacterium]